MAPALAAPAPPAGEIATEQRAHVAPQFRQIARTFIGASEDSASSPLTAPSTTAATHSMATTGFAELIRSALDPAGAVVLFHLDGITRRQLCSSIGPRHGWPRKFEGHPTRKKGGAPSPAGSELPVDSILYHRGSNVRRCRPGARPDAAGPGWRS